jgi:hypothetical protein
MRDDALPFARILALGAGVVATIAAAVATAVLLLHAHGLPAGGAPVARPAALAPDQPMLQAAPQDDLAAYRREKARERDALAPAASGAARVPVDVAMALLARRAASGASR